MFFAKNAEMGRVFRRFPGIKALSPVLPQRWPNAKNHWKISHFLRQILFLGCISTSICLVPYLRHRELFVLEQMTALRLLKFAISKIRLPPASECIPKQ